MPTQAQQPEVATFDAGSIHRELQPILEALSRACFKVEIVGSLRRGRPQVHDAELVLLPIREMVIDAPSSTLSLFGEDAAPAAERLGTPKLDDVLLWLQSQSSIHPDPVVKRMGDKLKRFVLLNHVEQPALELYIADELNYGCIMAIRTGSSQFSKAFMTPAPYGLKRNHGVYQKDGYLWESVPVGGDRVVACPDEETYFRKIGVPLLPPEDRSLATVRRLLPKWSGTRQ